MKIVLDGAILKFPSPEFVKPCLKAYEEGKERGLTWPPEWNYYPGGPIVYWRTDKPYSYKYRWEDCRIWRPDLSIEFTDVYVEAWHKGFQKGLLENKNLPADHLALKNSSEW